ncbi:MAG TPA: hypothetical protein VET85_02120 [Stellaceae bacterium]|nr:hypothetical protein [Stellaceae bacterium]
MPMPRLRPVLLSTVFAVLGAVVVLAVQREMLQRPAATPVMSADSNPQNALSADEEAYAAALWPIHSGAVEISAVELSFAGVDYVTQHPDRERLGARVMRLNDVFRTAAARAQNLEVPRSMQWVHDMYMEALALYVNASAEMGKVVEDGRIDHLIEAQTMSQRAAEDLLKVGDVLWPSEHKPN